VTGESLAKQWAAQGPDRHYWVGRRGGDAFAVLLIGDYGRRTRPVALKGSGATPIEAVKKAMAQ
jgi:hypothetical protein